MSEPQNTLQLPAHLTMAMNLLDSQADQLIHAKYQLLATYLKAERIEGNWGLVKDNTMAVESKPQLVENKES